GDREPQRQVLDGGFVTQGLLDDVVPGDRALADEVELPGPGQQGEHRLVYDVDRGLVPGADHQQQGVAQLVVGEPGAVALVVAGRDQQGRHVVAGVGALLGDELVQTLVQQRRVGLRLGRVQGGVEDTVDLGPEVVAAVLRYAHQVADHRDGKRIGQLLTQVHGAVGRQRGETVDDGVHQFLHRRPQGGYSAGAEGRRDQPAQLAVLRTVRGEHVLHRDPQGQRPGADGLFEAGPVRAGVL